MREWELHEFVIKDGVWWCATEDIAADWCFDEDRCEYTCVCNFDADTRDKVEVVVREYLRVARET